MVKLVELAGGKKPETEVATEMCEAIKSVVSEFNGKCLLATALGALEMAKLEILRDNL